MVDAIYVVVPEEAINVCTDKCIEPFQFQKVVKIVAGGNQRSDSVYNGLKQIDDSFDIVVIHDGVRIFVNKSMIENSINAAIEYGASSCAVPLNDTIKLAKEDLFVGETRNRNGIFCMQTPQTFKRDLIIQAYNKAGVSRSSYTDDTSFLQEFSSYKIKIVDGSKFNIKITSEEDLEIARLFLRAGY